MLSLIEANNFDSYSHVQKDDVRNLIEAMYGVISSTCVHTVITNILLLTNYQRDSVFYVLKC